MQTELDDVIAEEQSKVDMNWRDRLLVVCDSNEFTRRMTVELLRFAGASRVSATGQSSTAWYALKQTRNPILIGNGGQEDMDMLVRRLRRAPGIHKRAPAILIAGAVKLADVKRARDIGVDALAARPLAPQILFDRLDEVAARPRSFIDTPRFSGPDRRGGRPLDGEFKRQADVDAGLVSPLDAARAEARAVVFERLRMNDPLSARVGRSLEQFLAQQTTLSRQAGEVVALHRATLGKLVDAGEGSSETRMDIVAGLERLVSRRAA